MACDKPPNVPRIRTEKFPALAVLLADRVSVLLLVVLPGLKDAVTPTGKFEANKLTLGRK